MDIIALELRRLGNIYNNANMAAEKRATVWSV
jgi:hypothetical protein